MARGESRLSLGPLSLSPCLKQAWEQGYAVSFVSVVVPGTGPSTGKKEASGMVTLSASHGTQHGMLWRIGCYFPCIGPSCFPHRQVT
jgi:hypothetical protein